MEALRGPHVRGSHNRRPFGTLGSLKEALVLKGLTYGSSIYGVVLMMP